MSDRGAFSGERSARGRLRLVLGVAAACSVIVGAATTFVSEAPPAVAETPHPARPRRVDDSTPPVAAHGPATPAAAPGSGVDSEALADAFRCTVPRMEVPRTRPCERGRRYPDCRYMLPPPEQAGWLYRRWRLTLEESQWGSPRLVTLILAAAADYNRLHPGEHLVVGDLDNPGPRHATHDGGVDVDLYLPGRMAFDNPGGWKYPDNYAGRGRLTVGILRSRVQSLARILATCAEGRIRILYNDPVLERRFVRWFEQQGFETPFRRPMIEHNPLHRFHFHLTIDGTEPALPFEE